MSVFRVAVKWEMLGVYEVEADTIQDAVAKVDSGGAPYAEEPPCDDLPDGEFDIGSLKVDFERTKRLNAGVQW
jgi:hypothetical protein